MKTTEGNNGGSLERMVRRLVAYVGEPVVIEWCDDTDADWPTFRVLKVELRKQRVWLKGMDDTEGHKHKGDEFWVPIADIKRVSERPPNCDSATNR